MDEIGVLSRICEFGPLAAGPRIFVLRRPRKMPEHVGHSGGGAGSVTPRAAANSAAEPAFGLMRKEEGALSPIT